MNKSTKYQLAWVVFPLVLLLMMAAVMKSNWDFELTGFVLIIAGIAAFIFRKPFARNSVEQQNKTWGFHLGHEEIRSSERGIVLWSLITIVWGIVELRDLNANLPLQLAGLNSLVQIERIKALVGVRIVAGLHCATWPAAHAASILDLHYFSLVWRAAWRTSTS